jgi:hypothetical protein
MNGIITVAYAHEVGLVIVMLFLLWVILRVADEKTPVVEHINDWKHEFKVGPVEAGYAVYKENSAKK